MLVCLHVDANYNLEQLAVNVLCDKMDYSEVNRN